MMFYGPLENNLFAAIRSAKRIRGHPIHPTTTAHWASLLHEARDELRRNEIIEDRTTLRKLVGELENQITQTDTPR